MDLRQTLNEFKISVRDGAAAIQLAADSVAGSVIEATRERDKLNAEIQRLNDQRERVKSDLLVLERAKVELEQTVETLRSVLSGVKV